MKYVYMYEGAKHTSRVVLLMTSQKQVKSTDEMLLLFAAAAYVPWPLNLILFVHSSSKLVLVSCRVPSHA